MKRVLKWTGMIVGILVVVGFLGFLYFIPPFTLAPPEDFIKPEEQAGPSLDSIPNPAERAIAERGRYLVQSLGCSGCHTPGGDKGPKFDTEYLAGGVKLTEPHYGMSVSRNLTPDPATGLARRTDEQVNAVIRSGVDPDQGRIFHPLMMPWADFSNLTEEDRYAVVTFLRHLKPVYHRIPEHSATPASPFYGFYGLDYGGHAGE